MNLIKSLVKFVLVNGQLKKNSDSKQDQRQL